MNQQDMGPDYRSAPFTPDPQDAADDAAFRTCIGRPATATHETVKVFSSVFTLDFKSILSDITFADSDNTARANMAALHDKPKAAACFKNAITAQLSRSGGSAHVEVSPIDPPPGGANVDVIAYRLQILAGENGQEPQPLVVDLVSALKGRAEISAHFQDLNQPVPTDIQDRVIRAMLNRLPA
ncbi:MAG: hypothetical protein JO287_09065 [Pseudonocardiales bacterium]|nr:hypothetical protein [Pseudonocardiales bacterium]